MFGSEAYLTHQALSTSNEEIQLTRLYRRCRFKGWLSTVWSRLSGRSNRLVELSAVMKNQEINGRHFIGRQTISIKKIYGSEGRYNDFDRHFHPLNIQTQSRWISIAKARMHGLGLPPVSLIQVEEAYLVRDGHHRISVACALGEEFIDAEVVVWEID